MHINISNIFRRLFVPITVVVVFLSFLHMTSLPAYSQITDKSLGVAQYVPLAEENVEDGSIITFSENKYTKSRFKYDPDVIGVLTRNPAVVFKIEGFGDNPILTEGNAYVRVSGAGGPIKRGDQISASDIPGVGMKADQSGFVIGAALEDYAPSNPSDVKPIYVALNMHYLIKAPKAARGFFEALQLTAFATYEAPTQVFRYFLAGMVVIVSMVLAIFTFARVARNGIEALGRNPLAGRTIQLGILMNVVITVAIIFSGLAVAYLVLTL